MVQGDRDGGSCTKPGSLSEPEDHSGRRKTIVDLQACGHTHVFAPWHIININETKKKKN
jgi:hypothetical protein